MYELPLVVVNVQRGGPSTGLPTKTEQSDLFQAMYGRNGESPLIIVAASRPNDCFEMAFWAAKLTVEHMTPVVFLTDGYIANGAGPWRIPDLEGWYSKISVPWAEGRVSAEEFLPYRRDGKGLVRSWAVPGQKGYEHRLGGLEKEDETGNVSYDPLNHEKMCRIRQEKVDRVAGVIPEQEVEGPERGDLLVVSWGGTYGSTHMATKEMRKRGHSVSLMHLRFINPMPPNVVRILEGFSRIVVCELNSGQLHQMINGRFSIGASKYNKIQGLPFTIGELVEAFTRELGEVSAPNGKGKTA